MTPTDRYRAKVDERGPDECWPWLASFARGGYGQFFPEHRKMVRAHRYGYELHVGPIPDGLTIDHLCRNKWCQNPRHMEPVTSAENARRGNIGLRHEACKNGHPRTPENSAYWSSGPNRRTSVRCRKCANDGQNRRRANAAA